MELITDNIRANGKLLLFGEYFVLDGAMSLSIPTQYGQELHVTNNPVRSGVHWQSIDENGDCWLDVQFSADLSITSSSDGEKAKALQEILLRASWLNPRFFQPGKGGYEVRVTRDFPHDWGLGTSSTLVYLVAKWTQTDPFALFFASMQGSGYDVACASSSKPVLYSLRNEKAVWHQVNFYPHFAENIFFVYLGKKQQSSEAVAQFRARKEDNHTVSREITRITLEATQCKNLHSFLSLMEESESLISGAMELPKVKNTYFPDFTGSIKSLGAWGGDFAMACAPGSPAEIKDYFSGKGFGTVRSFEEMILAH